MEAGAKDVGGGLLGVLVGLGFVVLVAYFGQMPFHLDLVLVVAVLGGSLGLGLLAGEYPA